MLFIFHIPIEMYRTKQIQINHMIVNQYIYSADHITQLRNHLHIKHKKITSNLYLGKKNNCINWIVNTVCNLSN